MSWNTEVSVVSRRGKDYWRTWFIEECEQHQLFGLTQKHIPLITSGFAPYKEGTEIYLEDAPYYHRTKKNYHRICGPYIITPSVLPPEAEVIHKPKGKDILYLDAYPSVGPWFDRSYVKRRIEGQDVTFQQMASLFHFFPYRFSIRRSPKYKRKLVKHEGSCWLCA